MIINNTKVKQGDLFKNEPRFNHWLSELNHERRLNNEKTLNDTKKAKRQFAKLVARGFWN